MSAISFCLFAAVVSQEIRMPLLVQATCTTPIVPMHANGKAALVYEIQFTNYEKTPVDLETITATTGDKRILLSLSGAPLKDTLVPASEHEGDVSVIAPGETVVAYLWAETDPNSIPKSFTHRFDFKKLGTRQTWIEGLELKPNTTKLRNIDPPLEGSRWIAVNGPGNDTAHRRARFAMDGRCVIGQRFAIDYIMVGDDGKTFIGPADKNESYHCFGKNVLAVADATVVTAYQGVPINTPGHGMEIPMTVQTLPGNHVILDLGGGGSMLVTPI